MNRLFIAIVFTNTHNTPMLKHKLFVSLTAAITTIGITTFNPIDPARAVNLVTNGDFSINGGTGQLGFNSSVTGWTNNNNGYNFIFNNDGKVDTTGAANSYGNFLILYGPGNGKNNGLTTPPTSSKAFIAADGDTGLRGAITQVLNNLVVGKQYKLSFWDAGAQQKNYRGATTEQWLVSLIGASGTQSFNSTKYAIPEAGFSGWNQQNWTFTARDTSATLSFLASGTPNGQPPFSLLAGVSVEAVSAPEPLTFLGTITAFGVAAGMRAKLKQKKED